MLALTVSVVGTHCTLRWAPIALCAGHHPFGLHAAGYGNWADAPLPLVNGGYATYFGAEVPLSLGTLAGIEFVLLAAAESLRGAAEPEKRAYPGGAFDPVGLVSAPPSLACPAPCLGHCLAKMHSA